MSLFFSTWASAEEWIELTIPLEQGRYYSLRAFRQECQRKLGYEFSPENTTDRRLELTNIERAALHLAHESQLLRVQVNSDRLILSLPNPEDDQVRRANRRRLERWLGISIDEWPTGMGLHLPEDFHPQQRTVLLVYGLRSGPVDQQRLARACRYWGLQTLLFDYPNNGPLAWSGDRLSDELKKIAQNHSQAQIVVIAHSMGGLVVRHCLETPGKNPGNITDVFFLGTPHRGSILAAADDLLELIDKPLSTSAITRSLRNGMGEAGVDLLPDSHFLSQLNACERPKDVRYHAVIGSKSFLADEQRQLIEDRLKTLLVQPELSPSIRQQIRTFIQAKELQSGHGDGAVSVASAKIEDANSHRTFELNHFELLSLPGEKPQESDVFQWIVQTLQWRREDQP